MGAGKEVVGSRDVGVDVELWIFDRRPHPRPRRKMDDRIERPLRDDTLNKIAIPNIPLKQPSRPPQRGDIRPLDPGVVVIIEVINDADLMPVPEKPRRNMRTDKPSPSSNQNFHRRTLLTSLKSQQARFCFEPNK